MSLVIYFACGESSMKSSQWNTNVNQARLDHHMLICNQPINYQIIIDFRNTHTQIHQIFYALHIAFYLPVFGAVCERVLLLDWEASWSLAWVSVLKGVLKIYVEENCIHVCNLNFRWIIPHKSSKCLGTKPICSYFVLVLIQKANHLGKIRI